jgi:PHD/YefM family antitoxin component YafN of YafNO toxin-antitoxin module
MNIIRPVSDLRNNFAEISKLVHETAQPVFLTKNGYGDQLEYLPIARQDMIDII